MYNVNAKMLLLALVMLSSVGVGYAFTLSSIVAELPPDSPLYIVKVTIERIDLVLPIGDEILKREEFAQRRIDEAYYMSLKGRPDEAIKLVARGEELVMEIKVKFHPNVTVEQEDSVEEFEKLQRIAAAEEKYKNSIAVLQGLLADPNMPEASRRGLETALEAVQERMEDEVDELEDEAEELEDEVEDEIEMEIKVRVRNIVEEPDLSSCAGASDAHMGIRWRNPQTDEVVVVGGLCAARLYSKAGWSLVRE